DIRVSAWSRAGGDARPSVARKIFFSKRVAHTDDAASGCRRSSLAFDAQSRFWRGERDAEISRFENRFSDVDRFADSRPLFGYRGGHLAMDAVYVSCAARWTASDSARALRSCGH